jgi:hypothetical protein
VDPLAEVVNRLASFILQAGAEMATTVVSLMFFLTLRILKPLILMGVDHVQGITRGTDRTVSLRLMKKWPT